MSTVKITDLPVITHLDTNTANTIFVGVDLPSDTTGRITAKVIAEGLFANDILKVGNENVIFPNVIAQFSDSGTPYLQVNLQNTDANSSSDYVATADNGTDANNYIDMGINGSTWEDEEFSSHSKLDGYLYVHGSLNSSSDGNLIIGTASAGANVVFAVGGQRSSNVVAKISRYGLAMNGASYIEFSDGSKQTVAAAPVALTQFAADTANSASANTVVIQGVNLTQNNTITAVNQYAQSGFATANDANIMAVGAYNVANTASANTIILQDVNLTQNTNITTANNHAWAAFDKANNALANTTNIFTAGDFNVSRRLTTNGTFVLANSNFSATEAALTITASGFPPPVPPANDGYLIHMSGKQDVPSRVVADSYGANTYVVYAGRSARGTITAPTAVANNDVLFRISGNGYGTTGFAPLGVGRMDIVAAENHTDAARGSRIEMWNMPVGSNTLNRIAVFNGNSVEFTGTVQPDKGFIYVPTVLPGNQTAFTINFATTSLIKAELIADLTISLSNFVYGKVVEVWLTNTSGNQRTITHGCSATNSTTNSTTFNMSATSSAYLRYFSIDGDLANTFVAIQSA